MKRMTQLAGAVLIAAATVACGGNTTEDRAANNPDATAPAAGSDAAVGTSGTAGDAADFIADQLEDGKAEIELGKLAQQRATNPNVKEFAAMMVRDHTKAGEELRQLAASNRQQRQGESKPMMEETNRDHKNLREDLAKLNGREFDREYMDAMVKEHEEAVDELKAQAENGNGEVKQWAAKTLTAVQQHLEQAQQLQQSLNNNNDNSRARTKGTGDRK